MPGMKTGTIRQSVTLPAPPMVVFKALADSRGHSAFTGSRARLPRKTGGQMSAYDGYISGRVLGLWPGMGLLQTWRTSEWPEGAADSRLEIRLAPAGKGTRLTMIHSEVPAGRVGRYAEGWRAFYWKPLHRYLASLPSVESAAPRGGRRRPKLPRSDRPARASSRRMTIGRISREASRGGRKSGSDGARSTRRRVGRVGARRATGRAPRASATP